MYQGVSEQCEINVLAYSPFVYYTYKCGYVPERPYLNSKLQRSTIIPKFLMRFCRFHKGIFQQFPLYRTLVLTLSPLALRIIAPSSESWRSFPRTVNEFLKSSTPVLVFPVNILFEITKRFTMIYYGEWLIDCHRLYIDYLKNVCQEYNKEWQRIIWKFLHWILTKINVAVFQNKIHPLWCIIKTTSSR